ncbi:ABC-type nitrate/sulfonate/bicarbonate transport system, ATPase component [Sanguibacter keddieii DSM 10542]|uniref:ABC-type nitrate/sulfonate/bicarbonate transport system, ATPase component n=1 Tax=Sanguibacter keddieii (strain ATCC 51767 / DSM 10542 / NCFB 3025 / ST-74) TaxID=446469 RepID=D1BHE2_SANKS|nr:ABC transporter ATP-binding protein [Sanguibacter keddieii]ACZ21862.1 ABC-type nitrate/sulfonate/bicarbonate transport system, ATPase component [Sanguibacter keddieii DSM 10542]
MSLAERPSRPASPATPAQAPAVHAQAAQTVTLRHVHRTFATPAGPRAVLADVDLTITAGEIVAVLGTSGCGKSTLLRQVSGLDTPSTGEILIGETAVHGVDDRTAVAFQEPRLLPWRTIAQNVRLGLPRGTSKSAGAARVAELLELVGLTASADLRPRQVSGGMAQRASLARALARNPAVLLLDEPFGALDALTRLKMQDLLLTVHAAEPTTVVLVTHDVDEALVLADRIVLLRTVDPAADSAPDGARSVRAVIDVPGARPRDHADAELAALRTELLSGLGVPARVAGPSHTQAPHTPAPHVAAPAASDTASAAPTTSHVPTEESA